MSSPDDQDYTSRESSGVRARNIGAVSSSSDAISVLDESPPLRPGGRSHGGARRSAEHGAQATEDEEQEEEEEEEEEETGEPQTQPRRVSDPGPK